ncbi:ParB N-terminal domain-containing protein [Sorangium sp. So ce861]|uniref:ParB/RepB/Spo0J family partition protein n=1 Tax=Sorangium sp. So ce861 TaxID=3133323 RepID=UPI003F63668A
MKIVNDRSNATSGAHTVPSAHSQGSRVPDDALQPLISVREVAIADIVIPPERKPDPDIVRQLAASIDNLGLLNPILLTPNLELVAGRNRIAACVALGYTHIEARIETWGSIDRQLAEIDENLVRRRLPLLERGRLLARRKVLYEAIYPEARQHVRGGHARAAGAATEIASPAPAFATDAAAKLGTSERTVQEEIRIANELAPKAAAIIQGSPIEDEKVKLMELTRLPHDQQVAVAQLLLEGHVKSAKAAIAKLQRGAEQTDTSKGKVAQSELTNEEASAGRAPPGEAPATELPEIKPSATRIASGATRAQTVLDHLEAAGRALPDLRSEGVPPGVLADEVDEAVAQLATIHAHVGALVELLVPTGRGRGSLQGPRANVEARRGRAEAQPLSRWEPHYVWTLHRNPAALHGPVLAVRRRVLELRDEMVVEVARHQATLSTEELEKHGHARTYGLSKKKRGCEVSVWVYDHCPTDAERVEWLRRRTIENAALTSPPPDVWMLREGPVPGGPDEAVRCKTKRAWRTRPRGGDPAAERSTLEVKMRGGERAWIDLLELATTGKALDCGNESLCFYRDKPTPEELQQAGKARLQRMQKEEEDRREAERARREKAAAEEWWREAQERAQAYAEQFRQKFSGTFRDDAGEEALSSFGLKLPCTAEDVNRAFRKIVATKKPHPDQGGSDEAMRELVEVREKALIYVERMRTAA